MAKPNPHYGTGVFRRRIHMQALLRDIQVDLEDDNHGFRLRLGHDGQCVTGVEVDALRVPFNTCPEAVRPLQRVIGHRLDESAATLRQRLVPSDNCTHMYDMAVLAISQAARSAGTSCVTRCYAMAVDDERNGVTHARLTCDGRETHNWRISNHTIIAPAELAGQPIMRGFHAWASRKFSGLRLEAAGMLQRAYFVAQSRRHSFSPATENPATSDRMPSTACYSYGTGVVERAFRSEGTVRDFTDTPERLLQFQP